jgi:hypothetical protein
MSELQETGATEVPTFDPNKKYTWSADNQFAVSGAEFGLILNSLRAIIGTEEAARIILAQKASETVEGILARAVEAGNVKEME